MYENYTRQSLPSKEYRELLGTAIFVFNSNNAFVIENILNCDADKEYNWYDLIDCTSGSLSIPIKETITRNSNTGIARLFGDLVGIRNRIIHSFQIMNDAGDQMLRTKDHNHFQFNITEEFLLDFIRKNEQLSTMLHDFRGH